MFLLAEFLEIIDGKGRVMPSVPFNFNSDNLQLHQNNFPELITSLLVSALML